MPVKYVVPILLLLSGLLHADTLKCPAKVTRMKVEDGLYSPLAGAEFRLHHFSASMVARGEHSPLCFARTTDIEQGRVTIDGESLTRLFDQKVQESQSKISDVKVELTNGGAHLTGKLHKGISIPFAIDGELSTDGSGLILSAKKIKASGISVKGLLSMIGLHLSSLIGSDSIEGISASGNTLIFQPEKISHIRGHIGSLSAASTGLVIVFEPSESKHAAAASLVPQTAAGAAQ
jgi:hypothetical protein